jgi:hypothetical protein
MPLHLLWLSDGKTNNQEAIARCPSIFGFRWLQFHHDNTVKSGHNQTLPLGGDRTAS